MGIFAGLGFGSDRAVPAEGAGVGLFVGQIAGHEAQTEKQEDADHNSGRGHMSTSFQIV